jgi:hypothetical protein
MPPFLASPFDFLVTAASAAARCARFLRASKRGA